MIKSLLFLMSVYFEYLNSTRMANETASSKGDRGLTMVSDKEDPHAIVPDSTENEVTLLESIMIGRASFFFVFVLGLQKSYIYRIRINANGVSKYEPFK